MKTPLYIVLGLVLLFVVYTLIEVGFRVKKKADAQHTMFKNEDIASKVTDKLDSAAKNDIGRIMTIDTRYLDSKNVCAALQQSYLEDSRILCPINNGQKIKVLGYETYEHRVKIKYKRKVGYVDYNDILEYRAIAAADTFRVKR